MNVIVERQTVDWARTDVQSAAANFARTVFGETAPDGPHHRLTTRLIGLWDGCFSISFFACRRFLRELAHENWSLVQGCDRVLHQSDYDEISAHVFGRPGWVLFTDDDDWYAPRVFGALGAPLASGKDLTLWPRTRFDGELASLPVAADPLLCYTNNYALQAASLRAGEAVGPVLQHFEADRRVKAGEWSHATLDDLLSVTNKSPCSRNYLEKAMGAEDPAAALRRCVERYVATTYEVSGPLRWAEPWIERSRAFFTQVLRSRR